MLSYKTASDYCNNIDRTCNTDPNPLVHACLKDKNKTFVITADHKINVLGFGK